MRRARLRYSLMSLVSAVAALAIIMGALKAGERARSRQSLCRVRLTAALQGYEKRLALFSGGEIRLEEVYTWSRHVLESQRDLENTSTGRAGAAAGHLGRMEAVRKIVENEASKGGCPDPSGVATLDYYIKEAAFWVAAEK
jgi:hypothetical protein